MEPLDSATTSGAGRDHWLLIGSVALLVLGAKLTVIGTFGVDLPYRDQWYAEGELLYLPFLRGQLTFSQLFSAVNEHRVFFSRVLWLSLLELSGVWDGRLQAVVQAMLHAAVAAGLVWSMWRAGGDGTLRTAAPLVALAFGLPLGFENTLWGFQSQFYFLQGFSLASIWLLCSNFPWTASWWLGIACALAGLLSMASGLLAPAAVLATTAAVSVAGRERPSPRTWLACGVLGLVVLLGVALSVGVPEHRILFATGPRDLAIAVLKNLSWPIVVLPPYALLAWCPLLLLAWLVVKDGRRPDPLTTWLIALGVWTTLQALALAYGRGAGGPRPASRYLDLLSTGFVANGVALTVLWRRPSRGLRHVATLWYSSALLGLSGATGYVLYRALPAYAEARRQQVEVIREFLASGDARVILGAPDSAVPATTRDGLLVWLQTPELASILPPSVVGSHSSMLSTAAALAADWGAVALTIAVVGFGWSWFAIGGRPSPTGTGVR